MLSFPAASQAATKAVLIKSAWGMPACMNAFAMESQMNTVFHHSASEADIREMSHNCGWRVKTRQGLLVLDRCCPYFLFIRAQKDVLLNQETVYPLETLLLTH